MADDLKPPDANAILQSEGPDALRAAFDAGSRAPASGSGTLRASPYRWLEPAAIPPRAWLMGAYLCRGVVSMTVAPGGTGKSTLALCEAIALASGRDLLVTGNLAPVRCWYWNLEDSATELQRRVQAICQHHGVSRAEIEGRLFVDAGADQGLCLGKQGPSGFTIDETRLKALEATIRDQAIDVLTIDPFVSCHQLSENDNGQMDALLKALAGLAARTNIAISLIHHTRKPSHDGKTSTDSARGAKAVSDAARVVRVLQVMSDQDLHSDAVETPKAYVEAVLDKQNLAAHGSGKTWYRLVGVVLANGDGVGAVERWYPPAFGLDLSSDQIELIQAACREEPRGANIQARDWIGHEIARCLSLNVHDSADKKRIKAVLKRLLAEGYLKTEHRPASGKGRDRPIIVAGKVVVG